MGETEEAAYGIPLPLIQHLLNRATEFLKSVQNEDGGFPWDEPDAPSGDWVTAGVLWALLATGERTDSTAILRGLGWLLRLNKEMKDGGIPTAQRPEMSATDSTSTAIMAVARAYYPTKDTELHQSLERMTAYLLKSRCQDGGWAMWADEKRGMTINTAYALMALREARNILHDEAIESSINDTSQWLQSNANQDGWGLWSGNRTKAICTAFALLGLGGRWIESNKEISERALEFLRRSQQIDGTWMDLVERHRGISFHRFASPYCIQALVLAGETLDSSTFRRALRWLLMSFEDGRVRYGDSDIVTWPTRDALLALASIHSLLGITQLVALVDENLRLQDRLTDLARTVERLERDKKELLEERNVRVQEEVSKKTQKLSSRITALKSLAIVLPLLLIAAAVGMGLAYNLSFSGIGVIAGPFMAVWAFYAYRIYEIKIE